MTLNESNINYSPANWTTRKVIQAVLLILSIILSFWLVYRFHDIVIVVFTGMMISIAMEPLVNWLHRHKISRSLSVISIYLLLLLLLIGFVLLFIPRVIQQISAFMPIFEKNYQDLLSILRNSSFPLIRQVAENIPATMGQLAGIGSSGIQAESPDTINGTLNIAQNILVGLFSLSAVLLVGFYWTLEGERAVYGFLLFIPSEKRESVKKTIGEMQGKVGGFVRGQGLLGLTIGIAALLAYFLIGLPSILPLAFLAGVFELIPVFGPTLGAIPAALVAFSIAPSKMIWVVAATVLIQFLENNLLSPRVMKKTVGVNPIVTLLAIVGFGSLFGFSGLFLAIPLAAVFQVLLDRSVFHSQGARLEEPIGRDSTSKLTYDAQKFVLDVRKRVRAKEVGVVNMESDMFEDTLESIASDLDALLAQIVRPDDSV
jgi:predicted PurR-regulated permease PerM